MRILRNYILRETIIPFVMAMLVLTFIFLFGNLIRLTNYVVNKGVAIGTIGEAFLLSIPLFLQYTLPISCLISIIIGCSRMSSDNEILAIRASGLSLWRLLLPLTVVGLIASLVGLILNARIIPYAHHEQRKLLKNFTVKNPIALLEPGIFIDAFNDQIIFIHDIEDNIMHNVTIYQPQENNLPTRTIIAKSAEFTPVPFKEQIKLKLLDGTSDEPNPNNPQQYYKLNFQEYFLTLDLTQDGGKINKKPKSMTLNELKAEINSLGDKSHDPVRLKTEYHRKISWSFSSLLFVLIAFPIAVITNKRQKAANVVLAVILFGVYYLISLGCNALSLENVAPAGLIMWAPNLLSLIVAIFMNIKCAS